MQKHPLQMHLRHFVPAIFVAALAISILTVFTTPMTLGIVALYAGVNLQASFSLSRKYGWPNFIYLPIIFFTLHCSYGLGFWRGLFAFWNKWHRQ